VFENRVLRQIFGSETEEVKGYGGSCIMRNFIICTHPQISLGRSSQGESGEQGMWHAWERRSNCARFFVGKPERKETTWKTKV
jgi:hypothetical protein